MKLKNFTGCREYLAHPEALCNARLDEIQEGSGRGSRIIQVTNGSGLDFTVTPDRALDIVECRYRGIPLVFRTPVGYAHPARYESQGLEWLRNWPGGLMTTSGLRNSGNPNGEFGLHGRASNQQAEEVGITRTADDAGIVIRGVWREAKMFGENLRLKRVISTAYLDNSITVEDEIENLGTAPDYLQLLYHCNFGYPFVSPELRFEVPEHQVIPRDEHAAAGLAAWDRMLPPDPNFQEQCYFHKLPANQEGLREFTAVNPALGIRMKMLFSAAELPNLVEWKNCQSRAYVLGLEPGNVSLAGRTDEIEKGTARQLLPGEKVRTMLKFCFSDAEQL